MIFSLDSLINCLKVNNLVAIHRDFALSNKQLLSTIGTKSTLYPVTGVSEVMTFFRRRAILQNPDVSDQWLVRWPQASLPL